LREMIQKSEFNEICQKAPAPSIHQLSGPGNRDPLADLHNEKQDCEPDQSRFTRGLQYPPRFVDPVHRTPLVSMWPQLFRTRYRVHDRRESSREAICLVRWRWEYGDRYHRLDLIWGQVILIQVAEEDRIEGGINPMTVRHHDPGQGDNFLKAQSFLGVD
jgi:hypothetical protein